MRLFTKLKTAILGVVVVLLAATSSWATQVASKVDLNVRAGPGTNYPVIDQLRRGEIANTRDCTQSGWCYIDHNGPSGWVSSKYLTVPQGYTGGQDCFLSLTFGTGGPSMSVNCGTGGLPEVVVPGPVYPPHVSPEPVYGQACFYEHANFQGRYFCENPGTRRNVDHSFNDRISSIYLENGTSVTVCEHNDFRGTCRDYHGSQSYVGGMNDKISSVDVYSARGWSGTYSHPVYEPASRQGEISLTVGQSFNFDRGSISNRGSDLWFIQQSGDEMAILPRNGAGFAVGDHSDRGYAGCEAANFYQGNQLLKYLHNGSYVCLRTSRGNIGQFKVLRHSTTTLKLSYEVWQ